MATWRVNSYGYPNPFVERPRARGAWEMFGSFRNYNSYAALKGFWENHQERPVTSHAVESWKSTFEEFGLLYVLAGEDEVHQTPGGQQLSTAAEQDDDREFAWVGLSLLLRYPLRGNGRRSRGNDFDQSDLLLYWFLLASLVELEGIWQSELSRLLCGVFQRSEAPAAIEKIQACRTGADDLLRYPDPTDGNYGVYNNLNQVMVHGSLNHMLFTSSKEDSPYVLGEKENRWSVTDEYRDIMELALGGQAASLPSGCAALPLSDRMPQALGPAGEQEFFDSLGATVPDLAVAEQQARSSAAPTSVYGGETVYLLSAGRHFTRVDSAHILGPVHLLCVLKKNQRVIVDDELGFTYIVEDKTLDRGKVSVRLRQARPIKNRAYVLELF